MPEARQNADVESGTPEDEEFVEAVWSGFRLARWEKESDDETIKADGLGGARASGRCVLRLFRNGRRLGREGG
jgi:hypothetical protein